MNLGPVIQNEGFPGCSADKDSACNARNASLVPGSERSPGKGIGSQSGRKTCLPHPLNSEEMVT